MKDKFKSLLFIALISIIPTLLIWLPFFLRTPSFWNIPLPTEGMATVVANYDGPLYVVVAKTLYNSALINNFQFSLPAIYYAAHFPLFPLLIKAFAFIFGFPYSMLFVTVISSVAAIFFFSRFISAYVEKKDILWLTFLFAIFPARWLIVRSIGSPEPLFIATIIASIYYFKKEKFLLAGIFGAIATLTKSPGILLFVAYMISYLIPILRKVASVKASSWAKDLQPLKLLPLLLIPIALLSVFILFKVQFNDFFAYFHSGNNIHLLFPPFQIFNYSQPWVGTFWLEDVIFIYLFGFLGLVQLVKSKDLTTAWFVGIFFATTLFIAHRDLLRYSLPIVPFVLAGFSQYLVKKEFKIAIFLVLIPIYLYSLAFISNNVMPIGDWGPLL